MDISYYKKYEPIDGKWYITKELGSGSLGKVFEVERKDFGNMKSAMKIISVPSSESEIHSFRSENYDMDDKSVTSYFYGFVEEFIKEFQIMLQLKGHSDIVTEMDEQVLENASQIMPGIKFERRGVKNNITLWVDRNSTEELSVYKYLEKVEQIYTACDFDGGAYSSVGFSWPSEESDTMSKNNFVIFTKKTEK